MERAAKKRKLAATSPMQPNTVQSEVAAPELLERLLDNADVWERIFVHLEPMDRLRAEMVNKRLRALMLAFWMRERETSLNALDIVKGMRRRGVRKRAAAKAVVAVCRQIGDKLVSLKLTDRVAMKWSNDLVAISKACPNIDAIYFEIKLTRVGGDDFGANDFCVPNGLCFDSFVGLKKLNFVTRHANDECDGYVRASLFLSIPSSIESIVGLGGFRSRLENAFETAEQLETFFADRPSLRELRVSNLWVSETCLWADILSVIAEKCPLLKTLKLAESDVNFDDSGLTLLKSMKEIDVQVREGFSIFGKDLITICKRNPLIEVLALRGVFMCDNIGSKVLHAIGALTKLTALTLHGLNMDHVTDEEMEKFFLELGSNSGASLRRLDVGYPSLSMEAIEALADSCTKLRHLSIAILATDVEPASIRYLVDCIVADPSWNPTGLNEQELEVEVVVIGDINDDDFAPFAALNALAANLPAGARLIIIGEGD